MTRRSRGWIVIPFAFLFVLSSCTAPGKPGVKESPDNFDRAAGTVEWLADSYEKENASGFMRGVGRDYDLDYADLENRVRDEFDRFDAFDLTVIVDRVSADSSGRILFADTHWTKRRVLTGTGREARLSGRTTLIFRITPDGSLNLAGMKGDRIFGSP